MVFFLYLWIYRILFQALSALLLLYNRKNGLRSSGLQFLFWFLLALCGAVQFRSEIRSAEKSTPKPYYPYVSYLIYYPLVLAMVLLNCFADQAPQHSNYPKTEVKTFKLDCGTFGSIIWFICRGRVLKMVVVFSPGFCFRGLTHWHGLASEDLWKIQICGI